MIAALFVETDGVYYGIDDVDPWDLQRDARTYAGPHAVVAHPPCARWCQLAGLVEKRWGHKRGQDDGCFAAALHAVRTWGGVLEHPAWSEAWPTFDIPPPSRGGWCRDMYGGWSCQVEQGNYGHRARKATWLYAVGCQLPALDFSEASSSVWLSYCRNNTHGKVVERMGKRERARTPAAFRDVLLTMARSVR